MALALDDGDEKRAYVRLVMHMWLGRGPNTEQERDLHVWVLATQGLDLFLANIMDSPEGQAFRAKRGW